MQKAMLIYNPLSGQRSLQSKLDYVLGRFMEKDILLQPYRITGDCKNQLIELLKNGEYSFIVISGGDGTVNRIINDMLQHEVQLPIGLIPSGTCNDFARSIGIPNDLKKCIDIILNGKILDTDVGLINQEKYFVGTCAGGLFVDVSYNTSSELKRNLGPLAYYLKALSEVASKKPLKLRIETDEQIIEQDFLIFLILNGKHAAGFTNVNGQADLSDGYMDIILIKYCMNIDMVGMLLKTLKNDLTKDKNVMMIRTKHCKISGDHEVVLSVDGEEWRGLPIHVDFIHKAVRIFVKN